MNKVQEAAYEKHLKKQQEKDALPERVICAAVHYQDGKTYEHQPRNIKMGIVICGWRHFNCLATVFALKPELKMDSTTVQGFITTKGRFVDRKEGRQIAFDTGQTTEFYSKSGEIKDLFSEDLY